MHQAWIFIMLYLQNTYCHVPLKDEDRYVSIFCTSCSEFLYQVWHFGLRNLAATFQIYFDDCIWPYIEDFAICCKDYILIYSTNMKEHDNQVQNVLEWLHQFGFDCNAKKSPGRAFQIGLLIYSIRSDGSGSNMGTYQPSRMGQLPSPFDMFKCSWVSQMSTNGSFANTPRWLNQSSHQLKESTVKWKWTWTAKFIFWKHRNHLPTHQSNSISTRQSQFLLQIELSSIGLAGIFNLIASVNILTQIDFDSWTCSPAKHYIHVYDRELRAMVTIMRKLQYYLEGANLISWFSVTIRIWRFSILQKYSPSGMAD